MNCSFINNSLFCIDSGDFNDGGAISCNYSSNVTINKCVFINNSIHCREKCFINIGGALLLVYCNVEIEYCSFIENSLYVDEMNSFHFGGALNLAETCTIINYCFFCDNDALQGGDIFFLYQFSTIQIKNCIFERKNDNKNLTRSLIAFWGYVGPLNFTFKNNKVKVLDSKEMFIFAFDIGKKNPNCDFDNNCISPYNKTLFSDPLIDQIEDNNENILQFDNIFNIECDDLNFYPSSKESTDLKNTICFQQSLVFTSSKYFDLTMEFSTSNQFAPTMEFSNSIYFSNNIKFSDSILFLKTKMFSITNSFSHIKFEVGMSASIYENGCSDIACIFSKYHTNQMRQSIQYSNIKDVINDIYSNTLYTLNNNNEFKSQSQQYSTYFDFTHSCSNKKDSKNMYIFIIIIIVLICILVSIIIGLIIYKIKRNKKLIYGADESSPIYLDTYDDLGPGI